MSDTLEDWQELYDQRVEDLQLEMLRDEDDNLIKILKEARDYASQKIEELTDGDS